MVVNIHRSTISPIKSLLGGLTAMVSSLHPLSAQNTINGVEDQNPPAVEQKDEETLLQKTIKISTLSKNFYKSDVFKKLEESREKLKTSVYTNKIHCPDFLLKEDYDFFGKNTSSKDVVYNKPNLDMQVGSWFAYPSILPKSEKESAMAFSRIKIFSYSADTKPGEKKVVSIIYENINVNKKNVPTVSLTLYYDSKVKDEKTKVESVCDSLEVKVYQNGKELISKKSSLKERLAQNQPHCLAIMYQHEANIEKPTGKALLSVLVDEDPNTKEEKNNYFKTEMFTNSLFQPGEYQEKFESNSDVKIASLYIKENAAVREDKK